MIFNLSKVCIVFRFLVLNICLFMAPVCQANGDLDQEEKAPSQPLITQFEGSTSLQAVYATCVALINSGTKPESIGVILDVNDTLAVYSKAKKRFVPVSQSSDYVKSMSDLGVQLIAASAHNNHFQAFRALKELGILSHFNVLKIPKHIEFVTNSVSSREESGLPLSVHYFRVGNVVGARDPEANHPLYLRKAIAAHFAFSPAVSHIIFADDKQRYLGPVYG